VCDDVFRTGAQTTEVITPYRIDRTTASPRLKVKVCFRSLKGGASKGVISSAAHRRTDDRVDHSIQNRANHRLTAAGRHSDGRSRGTAPRAARSGALSRLLLSHLWAAEDFYATSLLSPPTANLAPAPRRRAWAGAESDGAVGGRTRALACDGTVGGQEWLQQPCAWNRLNG
jgi:hypothetical protein